MGTFYLDLEGGNDANDGTTHANRWKTFASGATAARTAPGDVIRVMGSRNPTSLGSCTWTNGARTMTIPSGTCKTLYTDGAWTAATNVTASTNSNMKQGANAASLAIASGFTTGIVGYFATGTLDLSTYQQLNIWIRSDTTLAGSVFRVDLCSDTVGAVAVDSFTVTEAIATINGYHAMVIDKGSALGSSIKSVSIVALSDPGTVTLLVDNVFVSKGPTADDCLTLNSHVAVSANPTGIDHWYKVQSVNDTTVTFEFISSSNATAARTYYPPTQTVTTYVRQCIVQSSVGASAALNTINEGGTTGLPITYSGGWNRTDMSTQDGETWITTPNRKGNYFDWTGLDFLAFEKFGLSGGDASIPALTANGYWTFTDCWFTNCSAATTFSSNVGPCVFRRCHWSYNTTGFQATTNLPRPFYLESCDFMGCNTNAKCDGNTRFVNATSYNSGAAGIEFVTAFPDIVGIDGYASGGNTSGSRIQTNTPTPSLRVRNASIAESTEFAFGSTLGETRVYSHNHDNVAGATTIFGVGYRVTSQTSVRHTASGQAWKISPTATTRNVEAPVRFKIANPLCGAGTLVTFSVWVQRDDTGLTLQLVCPVQSNTVATAVVATASAAINTWEQLTITVTPAVADCVEFYIYAYGGSTLSGYIDDIDMSQA